MKITENLGKFQRFIDNDRVDASFSKKEKSVTNSEIPNQGKLKLDASIADQYITRPTTQYFGIVSKKPVGV